VNADAIAAQIVRRDRRIPKQKRPWWMDADKLPDNAIHCGAYGPFCAICPETPPCVWADVVMDCEDCTAEDRKEWTRYDACPCWTQAKGQRLRDFRKWRTKHIRDNLLTRQRHRQYTGQLRKDDNYTQGRRCGDPDCDALISNRGKSGYCQQHYRHYKKKGATQT
jgi:hypothetical protein